MKILDINDEKSLKILKEYTKSASDNLYNETDIEEYYNLIKSSTKRIFSVLDCDKEILKSLEKIKEVEEYQNKSEFFYYHSVGHTHT